MTVFTLGRMRHLDLLALWCLRNPDGHHGNDGDKAGRMSKEWLVTILAST